MSKTSTYRIEIEKRTIETHEVDAVSAQAAAMALGAAVAHLGDEDRPEDKSVRLFVAEREISRNVGRPIKQTEG